MIAQGRKIQGQNLLLDYRCEVPWTSPDKRLIWHSDCWPSLVSTQTPALQQFNVPTTLRETHHYQYVATVVTYAISVWSYFAKTHKGKLQSLLN